MCCPLCSTEGCTLLTMDRWRQYWYCGNCTLIFVPTRYHCSVQQERERYALHDNTVLNTGYVRYLQEMVDILDERVPAQATVLDYGCGEHAVLTTLLCEQGYRCLPFDPLYVFPEAPVQEKLRFDAIILCEVIEHCRTIRETIEDLGRKITSRGTVFIRTQCYPHPKVSIAEWWYAKDPTHILFFSYQALEVVAELLGKKLKRSDRKDVFILS